MPDVKDDTRGGPQSNGGQPQNGGPNGVAQDIFRQVSALGGFLIVSFVAPIGGAGQATTAMERAVSVAGAGAKEKIRDMATAAAAHLPTQQGRPAAQQQSYSPESAPVLKSVNVVVPEKV
jgi:hypothetical protein